MREDGGQERLDVVAEQARGAVCEGGPPVLYRERREYRRICQRIGMDADLQLSYDRLE